jgi:hypothetical protein
MDLFSLNKNGGPVKKSICRIVMVCALVAAALGPTTLAQDSAERRQPELSGMTQGNTGCAVLEKHTPIKGKLLAVGVVYARTEYVVLDKVNCNLPKDKYTGPGDIKDLNKYAVDNKVKLVVIPRNYTDEELANAKNICREKPCTSFASARPPL